MRGRWFPLSLALAITSTSMLAASASARCKEVKPKRFFRVVGRNAGCSREGLEDITAMGFSSELHTNGYINFSKHAGGGYYLAYWFSCSACRGHFQVRTAEDPLVLMLKDGTEIRLQAVRDGSSIKKGIHRNYCGFYPITQEQLNALYLNRIETVKTFILPDDEFKEKRLSHTEDGSSYLKWTTGSGGKRGIRDKAGCALVWE